MNLVERFRDYTTGETVLQRIGHHLSKLRRSALWDGDVCEFHLLDEAHEIICRAFREVKMAQYKRYRTFGAKVRADWQADAEAEEQAMFAEVKRQDAAICTELDRQFDEEQERLRKAA